MFGRYIFEINLLYSKNVSLYDSINSFLYKNAFPIALTFSDKIKLSAIASHNRDAVFTKISKSSKSLFCEEVAVVSNEETEVNYDDDDLVDCKLLLPFPPPPLMSPFA